MSILSNHRFSYFAKYLPSLDRCRICKFITILVICLALAVFIIGPLAWPYPSCVDGPLVPSPPQKLDCIDNRVHINSSSFLDLYQLDTVTHQAVLHEIGQDKLLGALLSSYFVGRAALNKMVLRLTGRFACLLREYGTSDSQIVHAVLIGEIELIAKELSSLLSQLSELTTLSDAVNSQYSTFRSTAAAEADLLKPGILKRWYLIFETPQLEFVLQLIGRDLGEKWWIPWEERNITLSQAQLGLSTIQRELSSLDQARLMIEELGSRIERLHQQLPRHRQGWRFTLSQQISWLIDTLLFLPQETIERRFQETDAKYNELRSWYRDNIVSTLLLQDAARMQLLQPCSWGVQLDCSQ